MKQPKKKSHGNEKQITRFQPIRLIIVELTKPITDIAAKNKKTDAIYKKFEVLTRLNGYPIGLVDVDITADILTPDFLKRKIWYDLHSEINQQLIKEGLDPIDNPSFQENSPLVVISTSENKKTNHEKEIPFISVIVCTRDRTERLNTCLSSLLTLDYPNFEILVIDNAPSTDSTAALVEQYDGYYLPIHYYRENHPGLSWARNCGLKYAQGEIVAFLDDDEIADKYWLWELVKGFQESNNVVCVSGMIIPSEIETQSQLWFESYGGHSKGRDFNQIVFNIRTNSQSPLFPNPPFGAGGNMAFITSKLRELGGFDCALGTGTETMAGEDTAIFYDLLMQGYTLVYHPAALIFHSHRQEYQGLKRQFYGYGVGLAAFYTRALIKNPKNIFELIKLFPRGITILLRTIMAYPQKNGHLPIPNDLIFTKFKGILYGPFAYLKSRKKVNTIIRMESPNNNAFSKNLNTL